MTDSLKILLEPILNERGWSWTLVGIAYLVIGLIIRGWFLAPLTRKTRELDRKQNHELKAAYLKRSFLGWVFFLIPFFVLIKLWNSVFAFPVTVEDALTALGGVVSFIVSIVLHLQAFGIAAIETVKRSSAREKDI